MQVLYDIIIQVVTMSEIPVLQLIPVSSVKPPLNKPILRKNLSEVDFHSCGIL